MSRIAFFQTGFSNLPPSQVMDGDLRCFFHLSIPDQGASGNEFSFTFQEYFPFAYRLLSWHESIHLKKPGYQDIDVEQTYTFLTDEKSIICRAPPDTGFLAIYRHNGGFGAQRFEMVYTRTFFNGLTTDPAIPGVIPAPCSFDFFGRTGTLYTPDPEEDEDPPSGSISVTATAWRTYDGIYDPGDGTQVIFPLPTGL